MAATSFHKGTGKWLTSFGPDAKAGDIHTISRCSRSKLKRWGHHQTPASCEFTAYLLSAPLAHDAMFNEPLFDLSDCAWACALDVGGDVAPDRIRELHAMPALSEYPERKRA